MFEDFDLRLRIKKSPRQEGSATSRSWLGITVQIIAFVGALVSILTFLGVQW